MTREQIIKMYEDQINKAQDMIEKSSIKFEMKKHLEAYENGKEYKTTIEAPIECIGCGS